MRGTRWYARDRNSLTRSTLLIFRRGQPPVVPPLITRIKKARRWRVLGLGLSRCIPAQCLASLARTDRLLTGSSMHGAELAGGDRALWSWVLVGCILLTLGMLMPDAGRATCGQKCDLSYLADIDGCRFQYSNDPADADALADCIQEAKDDHQNCLGDCANPAISPPSRWRLAGNTLIVRCRGPAQPSSVDGLLTVSGAILP